MGGRPNAGRFAEADIAGDDAAFKKTFLSLELRPPVVIVDFAVGGQRTCVPWR
jgi:hypothetical protein